MGVLKSLQMKNFRCFANHKVVFSPLTVMVGPNNAGKSTVVESLRLLSWVLERLGTANFVSRPTEVKGAPRGKGILLPKQLTEYLKSEATFHRYNDENPAEITGVFRGGLWVRLYVGGFGRVFAVVKHNSNRVKNRSQAAQLKISGLVTLPQIGPLQRAEVSLKPDYVRSNLSTHLSSHHFRNQLNLLRTHVGNFRKLSQQTWSGLQIKDLIAPPREIHGESISLTVRDGDFVGEIGLMGHGLQMWLQTVWFLCRVKEEQSVVLDEPDVYLHADLQRKLIRLLRNRSSQVIIATHSIEIISEVEPEEILMVDRSKKESRPITSAPGVQKVVDLLGGVQNLQATRLWSSGRCLIVEGKDIPILKILHDRVCKNTGMPLDTIPNIQTGGWGGWEKALGAAMLLKRADKSLRVYCLFDRDYKLQEDLDDRRDSAAKNQIDLHIWSVKELENLLLNPNTIARLISNKSSGAGPSVQDVREAFEIITEDLKDRTLDAISHEYHLKNKSHSIGKGNEYARTVIKQVWETLEDRLGLVSGKAVISGVSKWAQDNYGCGLSARQLALEMRVDEIPKEARVFLTALDSLQPLTVS